MHHVTSIDHFSIYQAPDFLTYHHYLSKTTPSGRQTDPGGKNRACPPSYALTLKPPAWTPHKTPSSKSALSALMAAGWKLNGQPVNPNRPIPAFVATLTGSVMPWWLRRLHSAVQQELVDFVGQAHPRTTSSLMSPFCASLLFKAHPTIAPMNWLRYSCQLPADTAWVFLARKWASSCPALTAPWTTPA